MQKKGFFKTWPGEKSLSTNGKCDVKSGTSYFTHIVFYIIILFSVACKMPSRCAVYGCSNVPDPENGMILHKIPYDLDLRPEAIKRQKVWVDFAKRKRAKWEPNSLSCVCSKHFKADDFQRIVHLPGQQKTYRPVLKRDDNGITSFPSVYNVDETEKTLSGRAARATKRKVGNNKVFVYSCLNEL